MKKQKIKVESTKLSAFTGRVVNDSSRPCVFKDRKKADKLDRKKWKKNLDYDI